MQGNQKKDKKSKGSCGKGGQRKFSNETKHGGANKSGARVIKREGERGVEKKREREVAKAGAVRIDYESYLRLVLGWKKKSEGKVS